MWHVLITPATIKRVFAEIGVEPLLYTLDAAHPDLAECYVIAAHDRRLLLSPIGDLVGVRQPDGSVRIEAIIEGFEFYSCVGASIHAVGRLSTERQIKTLVRRILDYGATDPTG